ncbi:CHASE2 domain-containing protein, partial [bacterium]|nr:CHASE2 domain-containing protein [bacterium]
MLSDRKMGYLLALVALIITAAAQSVGWLAPTENGLLSLRYRIRGTTPPAPEIVIVSLEPESLREAGVTSWPPEVGLYTRTLTRLQECGAAVAVL